MPLIKTLKDTLLRLHLKLQGHQRSQQQLNDTINQGTVDLGKVSNKASPYFQHTQAENVTADRDDIVFITSRFRSGSTVLWNIFRNIDSCTSFYEPFNERKWFDKSARGEHVDNTHLGVDDYASEYDELSCLAEFYQEDWINSSLFMDQQVWDPKMKSYICKMIEKSPGRPILQFNRIDFRLPWLKQNFPNAKFVHLYRHPRDQWCSFLTDKKLMNKNDVESTYQDAFYLDVWCDDLAKHFPFLDKRNTPHPYQRFYYLWKLSYLYGEKLSDISIGFEKLTQSPHDTLSKVFAELSIDSNCIDKAASVLAQPPLNKWKNYADDNWFEAHEIACEQHLDTFLKSSNFYK